MTETGMTTPAATQPGSGGLSLAGLVEVFYKPEAFFKKLVEKPKVLVPYFVVGILLFIFLWLTRDLVWEMVSSSAAFQERTQNSPIGPEQMKKFFAYQYVIGGTVVMLLAPLIAALFGLFWGNFVFAGKAGFKQLLSIMLYGEVIYAVGAIVNLALILPRGNLMANLSLGVLAASQGADSMLYAVLSKFSVFLIWEIVAIGIGMAVLYNVKRGRGYTLSLLSMGLLTVIGLLLTAVGKMF